MLVLAVSLGMGSAEAAKQLAPRKGGQQRPPLLVVLESDEPSPEFVARHAARLDALFEALDLSHPGLEAVKVAVEKGERQAACRELLKYYAERPLDPALRAQPEGDPAKVSALALEDKFVLQGVEGRQPRKADGKLDWDARGPRKDPEWAWFLNRLSFVSALLQESERVGDIRYLRAADAYLQDWVISNPRPSWYSWSAAWRALEAARRIERPLVEAIFVARRKLLPETRLLVLSSIPDHGRCLRTTHAFSGNHLLSEMMGLALLARAWPEFRESSGWLDFACDEIRRQSESQVYPDGAHKELSNHYQRVALASFLRYLEIMGDDARAEPVRARVEDMLAFFSAVMQPNGAGPLSNDSDLEMNRTLLEEWSRLRPGGRPLRNAVSTVPTAPAMYFSWAGQAVMREGSGPSGSWAWFEMGPYGTDHQHDDRLHLSLTLGGRECLVDAGRYIYRPGPWRDYFAGPRSHNVCLLDGRGAQPAPEVVEAPLPVTAWWGAEGAFFSAKARFAPDWLGLRGDATWVRSVLHVRGRFWLVIDHFTTFGTQRLQTLWHFHPDRSVRLYPGDRLVSPDESVPENSFNLKPILGPDWELQLDRGRVSPSPQGWYSERFNSKKPTTAATYEATIRGPTTTAWLIWAGPADATPEVTVEPVRARRLSVLLVWPDGTRERVEVPTDGNPESPQKDKAGKPFRLERQVP